MPMYLIDKARVSDILLEEGVTQRCKDKINDLGGVDFAQVIADVIKMMDDIEPPAIDTILNVIRTASKSKMNDVHSAHTVREIEKALREYVRDRETKYIRGLKIEPLFFSHDNEGERMSFHAVEKVGVRLRLVRVTLTSKMSVLVDRECYNAYFDRHDRLPLVSELVLMLSNRRVAQAYLNEYFAGVDTGDDDVTKDVDAVDCEHKSHPPKLLMM